jgi:predicted nicotinamide N-methyase
MNGVLNEQIAPEILQAIGAQAAAHGLSVNDYLRNLLGLNEGQSADLALAEDHEPQPPRNEAMLAVLRRCAERHKDMPVSGSTEETLKIIRRARAGEMWGYEPTETE